MATADTHYTLFDTRFGISGLAFSADALTRIELPAASEADTVAKLEATGARRWRRGQPPAFVRAAIQSLRRHLAGKPQDLTTLPLALAHLPADRQRLYQAARSIAPGETITYAELAARAQLPRGARAATEAMAENPFLVVIPSHRVLGPKGDLHEYPAYGGIGTKRKLLALEGVASSVPRSPQPRRRPDGLEYDWAAALAHLRKVDPVLIPLIQRTGKRRIEIRAMHDPFSSLMRSIVYQQLSGKAAATILGRVIDLYPGAKIPTPQQVLDTPEARLRGAGLSGSKTKALKDLASKTIAGVVPSLRELHRLRDEEIVERLTSVWGIGQWSVEMMLMFRLGRSDLLPVDDLGVRKGFDLLYGPLQAVPAALVAHAERWRPYRTVASWLMWRAMEFFAEDKAAAAPVTIDDPVQPARARPTRAKKAAKAPTTKRPKASAPKRPSPPSRPGKRSRRAA